MSLKCSVPAVLIKTGTELEDLNDGTAQDQYNWRNIVFLPFNRFWQVLLICSITASYLIVTVSLVFNRDFKVDTRAGYYFCEAAFLINTIAIISHRNMASHRKTRYHPKTSSLIIFISVVTLIPLYEVTSILDDYTWKYDIAMSVTSRLANLKCILRLINVMVFFKNRKQQIGFSHLHNVICIHCFYCIIMLFMFTNILGLFWLSSKPNWADNLQLHIFNETHVFDKLFLTFHVVLGLFTHNWIGIINGVTFREKIIVLVIILTGFVSHVIFYGELTAEFLELYRHQFEFRTQLRKIMYLLDDWKVNKSAKKRTIEYYKLYWEKRSGINKMPRIFDLLPISLRKEIMMDIFWEALRHSSLFRNTDISFKRSLCLHMVNEFHLPGDLIFKADEIKNKMVYLVTGKVQLLSNEDNESPFLTLSGGTLLGEVSTLCMHTSKISIKCDTFCEMQTLDIKSLFNVLLEYRSVTKHLNKLYHKRIEYAKWASSDVVPKYDPAIEGSEKLTTVKKLKNQWKFIASYNNKKKTEINWKKNDRSFTSKYLSALVLADSTELKGDDICLQSKCPFIMQSDSNFVRFLNCLVTGSVIVQITVVPYAIIFAKDISSALLRLMLLMDLFYWIDIYLQLSTAIKITNSITLVEPKQIIQYKFKQWSFVLDIISAIPAYYISLLLQVQTRIMLLSNGLRLLKVPKLFKLIQEKEKDLCIENIYIQSVKYFVLSVICVYWGACILYAASCFNDTCHRTGWYLYNKERRNLTDANPFAKVLSFSVSLLLNTNLSDYAFFSISDIYICIVFLVVCYVLTTFTLAELTASVALLFKEPHQHQNEIEMFQIIMKRRFVHKELKARLLKILEFNWEFIEGAEIQGKRGILSEASREIRTEVINERFISCFKLVPLLKNLPETMLQKLSLQAEVIILPPDTYVQNVNIMSHNIYIILRGYCQVNSMLPGDAEREAKIILKRGDMLATIETLHRIKIFGSIVSITAVELMSIHYETFMDIFQSYRNEYMFLQNALKEHKAQFDSILMRRGCRLPEMKSAKESLGRVDTFRYKVDNLKEQQTYNEQDLYLEAFKSLGSWAFVRFLLLRETIDPKSTIYVTWEIFRCACILLEVTACIMFITVPLSFNIQRISYACRIVTIIDMYVRLHCQYYNENGITVRHPLYTAQKYVGSSFAVDAITNLPVHMLFGRDMFGKDKGLHISIISQLILRPILLYRVFHGLTYLQNKLYLSGASILLKVKTTIILLIILGLLANVLLITTCTFDSNYDNCTNAQYIEDSIFSGSYKTVTVFLQALHFTVESFTHSVSGVFGIENDKEIAIFLTIQCILYCLRCLIIALYTSSGIGGNANLSIHQAHMKQFVSFAKDLLVEENLTKKVVEHYEHVWKETLGTSINVISNKFNLYLRIQFLCFLYEGSLRSTKIFALAPSAIVQRLAPCLREVHFKRGGTVIRCNDVQKDVYFVHEGEVDITVANTVLTTLDVGGLFGCFHRSGIFRQTFTATCVAHTILLALDSTKFQEIISEWGDKHTEDFLRQVRLLNVEYMEANHQGTVSSLLVGDEYIETRYDKIIRRINHYVDPEGAWYRFFDYILNVHFAAIASISNMAYLCIYLNQNPDRTAIWLFYLTDLIFWIKIFLRFHMAFVNPTTGLLERNAKKIAVHYLKTDFALDLFSCLPIELVFINFFDSYFKFATFNRVLRFIFVIKYYKACQQKLLSSKHLWWSYWIYKTMFRIQLMANVWFLVSCLERNCYYVKERFGRPKTISPATNSTDSALAGYTYTINIFSTTGMRDTVPINWKELMVSIGLALFAQFMIANMASGFAQMIIIDRNTLATYQHNINKIKIYLSGRHLSPALLCKAWEYYMLLWQLQEGECLPALITMAPSYLKQDVMLYLFGYHLENHFLFAKTHKDFIRQLVTLLERRVYLPGNTIVEKGDVDSTIYFVHTGEVGAFDKHGANEVQCFVVKSDMSFGEAQGLYNIPHKMAYKSLTVTFVLALRKSVWEYLLKWFPASRETIMQQATEYNLKAGQQL